MSRESVKSADRVLRILELVAANKDGCPASGVARSLDIPLSSCLGLLSTMHSQKFLNFDQATRKYTLAEKVSKLAASMDATPHPLEAMAIRCARQLNRQLGNPVAVSRRVGLFVEWAFTVGPTYLQPGSTMPIFKCFNGLTAMSHLTESQLASVMDEYNNKFGRELAVQPTVMKPVLAYRGRDYAAGGAPSFPGLAYVCFRLTDAETEEEALLTVRMPINELSYREPAIVKAVRDCVAYQSSGRQKLAYAN